MSRLTLGLLKPDVLALPHVVSGISRKLDETGVKIIHRKVFQPDEETKNLVEEFYKEHDGKFFHRRLVEYRGIV